MCRPARVDCRITLGAPRRKDALETTRPKTCSKIVKDLAYRGLRRGSPPDGSGSSAPALELELDGYAGPLDLLLELARAQKVDLNRISVLALVEQYLGLSARRRAARFKSGGGLSGDGRLAGLLEKVGSCCPVRPAMPNRAAGGHLLSASPRASKRSPPCSRQPAGSGIVPVWVAPGMRAAWLRRMIRREKWALPGQSLRPARSLRLQSQPRQTRYCGTGA